MSRRKLISAIEKTNAWKSSGVCLEGSIRGANLSLWLGLSRYVTTIHMFTPKKIKEWINLEQLHGRGLVKTLQFLQINQGMVLKM